MMQNSGGDGPDEIAKVFEEQRRAIGEMRKCFSTTNSPYCSPRFSRSVTDRSPRMNASVDFGSPRFDLSGRLFLSNSKDEQGSPSVLDIIARDADFRNELLLSRLSDAKERSEQRLNDARGIVRKAAELKTRTGRPRTNGRHSAPTRSVPPRFTTFSQPNRVESMNSAPPAFVPPSFPGDSLGGESSASGRGSLRNFRGPSVRSGSSGSTVSSGGDSDELAEIIRREASRKRAKGALDDSGLPSGSAERDVGMIRDVVRPEQSLADLNNEQRVYLFRITVKHLEAYVSRVRLVFFVSDDPRRRKRAHHRAPSNADFSDGPSSQRALFSLCCAYGLRKSVDKDIIDVQSTCMLACDLIDSFAECLPNKFVFEYMIGRSAEKLERKLKEMISAKGKTFWNLAIRLMRLLVDHEVGTIEEVVERLCPYMIGSSTNDEDLLIAKSQIPKFLIAMVPEPVSRDANQGDGELSVSSEDEAGARRAAHSTAVPNLTLPSATEMTFYESPYTARRSGRPGAGLFHSSTAPQALMPAGFDNVPKHESGVGRPLSTDGSEDDRILTTDRGGGRKSHFVKRLTRGITSSKSNFSLGKILKNQVKHERTEEDESEAFQGYSSTPQRLDIGGWDPTATFATH